MAFRFAQRQARPARRGFLSASRPGVACRIAFFVTSALLVAPIANAQIVHTDTLLSGGSVLEDSIVPPTGLSSYLLARTPLTSASARKNNPFGDGARFVLLGATEFEAVRTIRNGRHTGDLFGIRRYAALVVGPETTPAAVTTTALSPPRAWQITLTGQQNIASGLLENRGQERTTARFNTDTFGIRALYPINRVFSIYGGYDSSAFRAPAEADELRDVLPLFDQPGARVEQTNRLVSGGIVVTPPGDRARLELNVASVDAPGFLRLEETTGVGTSRVQVPLGARGVGWSATGEAVLAKDTWLTLHARKTTASGEHFTDVRNAAANFSSTNGRGQTNWEESGWGVRVRRAVTRRDVLGFGYTSSRFLFATRGGGLSASSLGYDPADFSQAGYYLTTRLRRWDYGAEWQRQSGRHEFRLGYNYLVTPFSAEYGIFGALFLFGFEDNFGYDEGKKARGHMISLRYDIPVARQTSLSLRAAQVIPMPARGNGSNTSGGGGGSTGGGTRDSRRSRGGWFLGASLAYRF